MKENPFSGSKRVPTESDISLRDLEERLMNPPLEDYEKAPDELGDEYLAQKEDVERERQAAELDADAKWDRQFAEAGQQSLAKRNELLVISNERMLSSAERKELAGWEKELKIHWPELLK